MRISCIQKRENIMNDRASWKLTTVIVINIHTHRHNVRAKDHTGVFKSDMQLLKLLDTTGLLFDYTRDHRWSLGNHHWLCMCFCVTVRDSITNAFNSRRWSAKNMEMNFFVLLQKLKTFYETGVESTSHHHILWATGKTHNIH